MPYNNLIHTNTRTEMTDLLQKRFVDLGQTLYIEWLKNCTNMKSFTEKERRALFKSAAELSFEAAAEFSKVFRYQEDN